MDIIQVDLPESLNRIELYPLADIHLGDTLLKDKQFCDFIQMILTEENRYIICNGDLISNNLKNSIGSVYEDTIPPSQQKKEIRRMLEPAKDRILAMTSGNHERRSKKEADQDITEDIAEWLGVPYREEAALIKLSFGKKENGKRQVYTIYATHGWAGGRKPGNAINNIEDLSKNVFADIYLVGHAHKRIAHRALYYLPDLYNNQVREIEQLYVSSSAWLEYGGYASHKGMRPQVSGTSPIYLESKVKQAVALV